jgi:hypothetical protein
MMITYNATHRLFQPALLAICVLLASAGCTVDKQSGPALSGPSGNALSLTVTATPDILPADGSSVSLIKVSVRDADGKAKAGQRVVLSATNGLLSASEVTTATNGEATVQFIAPPNSVSSSNVVVFATPVGVNLDNTNSQSASIGLTGVVVPSVSFTPSTTTPGLNSLVSFDASPTTINGSTCGTACVYAWDFGDGSSASGITTTHRFASRGAFVVHLAVTSPTGSISGADRTLTVGEPTALTASIRVSPTNPVKNVDLVNFDGSASTTPDGVAIVSYVWDFGDGTSGTGVTTQHMFTQTRTYVVRLTITDALGRTGTTTASVSVT